MDGHNKAEAPKASFGYRDVPASEKPGLIGGVFSTVARRYDLMNDLMSGGVHRLWKDAMIDWLAPRPGWRVADVAGGTGDIAFRIARAARKRGGPSNIAVCDINQAMLQEGRGRKEAMRFSEVSWICGDAEALPLESGTMDAYTIAFGIRNTTYIEKALAEAYRVLAPGGHFLCLEFSRLGAPGFDRLYDLYSFSVLPRLGELVAGDGMAYRYLAESIRRFPPQSTFARMIEKAGFTQVRFRNMSGGVVALHSGWKA